jgi:hypothetical protein
MVIKPRVTQIFKRQIAQPIQSTFNRARSGADFIQKIAEKFGLHQTCAVSEFGLPVR